MFVAETLDHSLYLRDQGVDGGLTIRALDVRDGLASTDPNRVAHRSDAYLVFWFLFQILGGQVLMLILIGTFVFTRARRHASLVNFCASYVLTGICSSLLCVLVLICSANGPNKMQTVCRPVKGT